MNDPLDDLLKRSRRVHGAQRARIDASEEEPRPGYVDRVLTAHASALGGRVLHLAGLTRAAGWGLAVSACTVLSLWSLPPPITKRPATVEAAAEVWQEVTGQPEIFNWGGLER